jgi:hypothetical protein
MPDLSPLVTELTGGTLGSPEAAGIVRRVTVAELAAYGAQVNSWLANECLLARGAGDAFALALPPLSLAGRGASGSLRAMFAADIDAMLGLSTLIGGRAPIVHAHTMAEVTGLATALGGLAPLAHFHPANTISAIGVPDGYGGPDRAPRRAGRRREHRRSPRVARARAPRAPAMTSRRAADGSPAGTARSPTRQ